MKHNCKEADKTITVLRDKIADLLERISTLEADLREARNMQRITDEMSIKHGVELGAR